MFMLPTKPINNCLRIWIIKLNLFIFLCALSSFTCSYGTTCRPLDESSLSERAVLISGTVCRKAIQDGSGRPCAEIQIPALWSWDLSSTAAPAPLEFHLPPSWWMSSLQSSPTHGLLRIIYALELELPPLHSLIRE